MLNNEFYRSITTHLVVLILKRIFFPFLSKFICFFYILFHLHVDKHNSLKKIESAPFRKRSHIIAGTSFMLATYKFCKCIATFFPLSFIESIAFSVQPKLWLLLPLVSFICISRTAEEHVSCKLSFCIGLEKSEPV